MNRTRRDRPDEPVPVKVRRLRAEDSDLPLPAYMSADASGMDLAAGERVELQPGQTALVPTGFSIEVPPGHEGQVRPRSGLALKRGVTVLNAPGTIDADYRGEVRIILINHGREPVVLKRGDRIAQLVICPVARAHLIEVEQLKETERGPGGFGHTGVHPRSRE